MDRYKIAIIGLGYVGLPLARLFATKYPVVGFDINKERVEELMSGNDSTLEVEDEEKFEKKAAKKSASSKSVSTNGAKSREVKSKLSSLCKSIPFFFRSLRLMVIMSPQQAAKSPKYQIKRTRAVETQVRHLQIKMVGLKPVWPSLRKGQYRFCQTVWYSPRTSWPTWPNFWG